MDLCIIFTPRPWTPDALSGKLCTIPATHSFRGSRYAYIPKLYDDA